MEHSKHLYFVNTKLFTKLPEPVTLRSELIANDRSKLIWLMWTVNKFYDISQFDNARIFNNNVEIFALPMENDHSFVACLGDKDSNRLLSCEKPHFIRSSKLGINRKLLYFETNDRVILRCDNNGYMNKYKWYKDGKIIKLSERLRFYGSWILIENITSEDYGHYECLINKPSTMPYKLSIFLINFYNSSNLLHLTSEEYGQNLLILPCQNPTPEIRKTIFWNYNIFHRYINGSTDQQLSMNLNMHPYNMSGLYQCFVHSPGNMILFSYYFHMNNNNYYQTMKHVILKKRSLDESGIVSDFKYMSTSNSININWSPPSTPVKSYTFHWGKLYPGPEKKMIDGKETKFVIESLIPETNYYVKIDTDPVNGVVKSVLQPVTTKRENREIILTIPINLKLIAVGDTWSTVSWDYRENSENINKTFYQVEYYQIRGQIGNKQNINTSSTKVTIKNISPATTYEITVRSCLINTSKCSDWSMVLEFTSQETKPSDPPQHLTLSTIQLKNVPSDNSLNKHMFAIQVSWQPPKRPNGEIKNYLILVTADRKLEMDNWGERTVSGKTLNTVIDRLDLNRYYYFRIGCSNEFGKSPFSSIRIFKTPDENGKNGGPILLSKEYLDAMEIDEEMKIQTSNERGSDNLLENNTGNNERKPKNNNLPLNNHKWWIIIAVVVGATLVFILIILFLFASKCRNDNIPYENGVKVFNSKNMCDMDYRKQSNEVVKFVNKGPILTTPDLFRHTNDQNCHQNYLEMEERTESPNSFSSNKGFQPSSHNQTFTSQQNYRGIPGHYTPPGLIHQQNMVMTTSQLTSNSNERQFYQVPFLHHIGHNPLNVFTNSAPRVNAAASDFNSINIPSPISGYSDFTSSQATVLYDTSTAKSSGGKSSLSGSGSYNNGLGNKTSLVNEPISEGFNSPEKSTELKNSQSSDTQHLVSKAFSSEELSQEMANLEGLMKDLNSITQKEFEC